MTFAKNRHTAVEPGSHPGTVRAKFRDRDPGRDRFVVDVVELEAGEAVALGRELILAAFEAQVPVPVESIQVSVSVSVRIDGLEAPA